MKFLQKRKNHWKKSVKIKHQSIFKSLKAFSVYSVIYPGYISGYININNVCKLVLIAGRDEYFFYIMSKLGDFYGFLMKNNHKIWFTIIWFRSSLVVWQCFRFCGRNWGDANRTGWVTIFFRKIHLARAIEINCLRESNLQCAKRWLWEARIGA